MKTKPQYRYKAFISYSSKDRFLGERFQRALERYVVPTILRGRTTASGKVPKRIAPIYRDRSDLEATNDLGESIRTALALSEFLVVLCSPHSASSAWVNTEIVEFKLRMGRSNIIAVLLEGDPVEYNPHDRPNGAFPPSLVRKCDHIGTITEELEAEVFAPDIRNPNPNGGGDGFEFAKLKVVARLLDIPLVELTQREAEAERLQRRLSQAIATALLVLTAFAVIAGTIAWQKALQANQRLQDAIAIASRQIRITAEYRDRYGVPAAVIQELLNSAENDFGALVSDAGTTPSLVLQRAELLMSFADQFELAGDGTSHGKIPQFLAAAEADIQSVSNQDLSIPALFGLVTTPDQNEVAIAHVRLLVAKAKYSVLNNDFQAALLDATASQSVVAEILSETHSISWRREAARIRSLFGNIYYRAGRLADSKVTYQEAVNELEALVRDQDEPSDRLDLIDALTDLATTQIELNERNAALDLERRAADVGRGLVARKPDRTELKRTLLIVLTRLGDTTLSVQMDPSAGLVFYSEAESISANLTSSDPARLDWKRDRYILLERIASAHLQSADSVSPEDKSSRLGRANDAISEGIKIVTQLLEVSPSNLQWLRDYSVAQERLCQIRAAQFRSTMDLKQKASFLDDAEKACASSVETRAKLLSHDPSAKLSRLDFAIALAQLGEVQALHAGKAKEALNNLTQSLTLLEKLRSEKDSLPIWQREEAKIHYTTATLLVRLGRTKDALIEFELALGLIHNLRGLFPAVQQYQLDEADLQRLVEKLGR